MIEVRAKVDLRDVYQGLDGMADPRALSRGVRALKRPLREDQRDHARKAEGPDGRWAARKLGGRRRPLGRLPGAVKTVVTADAVSVISKARWSEAHMTGATVGHGAKLAPRVFLWVSDGLATTAADLLRDAVLEGW